MERPAPLARLSAALCLATLAASWAGYACAAAGKAHEHGVARLDVGVEAGRILLSVELPLDSLTGFERAPRTDAERAAVVAALGKLQAADTLVRVDPAAGCGAGKVTLASDVWTVGPDAKEGKDAKPPAKEGAHGDLDVTYEFLCPSTQRATFVEVGLFDAFPRLQRIEVQAVTPRGQMKLVLRRPAKRIGLAR